MTLKVKQKWGLIFLLVVSLVYVLIHFIEIYSSSDKVTEIYFADRITKAHKILIDRYNLKMAGKVRVIPIDFPNYDFSTNERKELLARSLRGRGDGIDLFAVDLVWVQRFAKWCEPLDKYFTDEERSRILSSALESCYYDGELVAMPLDLVQGIMYYREDLIKQSENSDEIIEQLQNYITWEDFLLLKNKLPANPFYIFPAAEYEGLICSFMEMILSIKPDYFVEYGFNFNTDEAKKSLQFLVDLINKYGATPKIASEFTEIPSYEYFIKNDALFIHGWVSYDKDFEESPFDLEKQKKLRKAPLPHFKDGNPTSVFGGWNLMVSKFSDKKEEVVHFIKFLLSNDSQELFYEQSGFYPVINKIYDDQFYIKKFPEIHKSKDIIKTGVHRPSHVEYTRYSEIMSHFFGMAIRKEISVQESLEKTTNNIQFEKVIPKEF